MSAKETPAEMTPLELQSVEGDSELALERDRHTVGEGATEQERVIAVIKHDGAAREIDIAADRVKPIDSADGTQEQLVRDIIGDLLEEDGDE